jgi:hypothetical protein
VKGVKEVKGIKEFKEVKKVNEILANAHKSSDI